MNYNYNLSKLTKYIVLSGVFLILSGCGGKKFTKSPVDELAKDMTQTPSFSIILYDMDTEGIFFPTYRHQYRIIKEDKGRPPEEEITGWYEVSKDFFGKNENNMGMEIVSKNAEGKISKVAAPPGYSNYVGNQRYGSWQTHSGGHSFWAFYGQYAFMSSMFNMMTYPARRSYYNTYRSGYGAGRSYYGPRTTGGGSYYGTNSDFNRKTKPTSKWNNNFRNRVRSSTTASSRSGSRYSSGSSFRSRGGGFGK
ncbi:MAG: hypothetical protein O7F74_06055 [Bacteroidetes bacterium]|nr:hypothetical protein [Bacteroidota bacterium]